VYAVPSWNNNHYVHFVEGEHQVVDTYVENDFMPVASDILPYIKGATLLALCSPQNPTGTTFSKDELERICDMVIDENNSRAPGEKMLYVMFDQMYWHLTYGDIQHYNPVSLRPEMRHYTIFVDAISKVFAATGVRVGWAMGPAEIIDKMKSLLTHLGAWAPMAEQKAVARYLLQKENIQRYLVEFKREIAERLRGIYDGFIQLKSEGLPVNAIAPQAAIYLTVQIDLVNKTTNEGKLIANQAEVTSYILNEARLALVPFYAFGTPRDSTWYRLSVGTSKKEEIGEMISQLRLALQKLT
jgi:aspartate aminotransferase